MSGADENAMTTHLGAEGGDWTVGVRVWVERAGHPVLGKGRLELLEGIDRHRSISAAARELGMSYRRAWLLVQSINAGAGERLVEAATGGTRGGGAWLTPRGHQAIALFRELQRRLEAASAIPSATATGLHVVAAVSMKEVLGQLLADYACQEPNLRVRAIFGASNELADYLLAGSPADLILVADPAQLDRLEAAGRIDPASRVDLARNGLTAIGSPDGVVRVRRPEDLLRPEVAHICLAEPASPLGGYSRDYLQRLRLYDALRSRTVEVDNAHAVMAAIHAGRADVGLVYDSDALTLGGCRVLFRAGRRANPIRYAGAVARPSSQADLARALLTFFASRPAERRFRQCGFLPAMRRNQSSQPRS
jgi:molybdenum ABC transporter molybdate-binding protein